MDATKLELLTDVFVKNRNSPDIFSRIITLGLNDTSFLRRMCAMEEGLLSTDVVDKRYFMKTPTTSMELEESYLDIMNLALADEEDEFLGKCEKYKYEVKGDFSFQWFQNLIYEFQKEKNLELYSLVIPFVCWPDVVADVDFSEHFEPTTEHRLILSGYLGRISGVHVYTDGYRQEEGKIKKLIENNRTFVYAFPKEVGTWESTTHGSMKVTRDCPSGMYIDVDTKFKIF